MTIVIFLFIAAILGMLIILLTSRSTPAETYVEMSMCKDSFGSKTMGGDYRLYKTENGQVCIVPDYMGEAAAPKGKAVSQCTNKYGHKQLAGDDRLWGFEKEQPCVFG